MSSDEQTPRNGGAGGSKTGRKGDPRMHRAVAARLADPNLSLFDALRIGGFNYPTDDDSSCIDSENVKLGQRKNQLSRRVRMARRQVLPEHSGDSGSSVTGQNVSTRTWTIPTRKTRKRMLPLTLLTPVVP